MQAGANPLPPEQHDAEETCFQKESRQYLVAHQRADDRTCLVGEYSPVGAKLVGHHNPGDNAHAEGDGKDCLPEIEKLQIDLAPGLQI